MLQVKKVVRIRNIEKRLKEVLYRGRNRNTRKNICTVYWNHCNRAGYKGSMNEKSVEKVSMLRWPLQLLPVKYLVRIRRIKK